jgi:hypothetical protein
VSGLNDLFTHLDLLCGVLSPLLEEQAILTSGFLPALGAFLGSDLE